MSEQYDNDNDKEEKQQKEENEIENKNNEEEVVDWKSQCIKGNLMPGIIMLERKKIDVNDEVSPENGNTLLHYAAYFGFYNVIRALIEIYHADINKKNLFGFTPIFYIVSNTDANIFNFQYVARIKDINFNIEDMNGLNILVHSIITNFHHAFLFFSYLGLVNTHRNDKFSNPLIYFAIVNNNKFALSYLLINKNFNINDRYYNNTSVLSDILITNKNTSITKFLVKYFNKEISLNAIHTCKKSLLNFPFYNVYNYELLNTLYFYKTKTYWRFFVGLLKRFRPKFNRISNQRLLEDYLVNNEIGYKYKMINIKYMIYDLVLPNISKGVKLLLFLLYLSILYICTKRKLLLYSLIYTDEDINISSLIYKTFSFLILYIWFIIMFNAKDKAINNETDIEFDIANAIKNGNIVNLPYTNEICPACDTRKKIKEEHCFRCKGCFENKFFHSNLFQICITKHNIKKYLFYLILKINFYFICLFNCLDQNKTNKSILAFFCILRYKTELFTVISEFFIGFFLFKEIGHFIALCFCLSVQTPYQFIYKYHKKVYPETLREKKENNMIAQLPEINKYIPFGTAIKNILKNIC